MISTQFRSLVLAGNQIPFWADAKQLANENGPKLAHFIFDYKNTCKYQHNKDVNVRLVAHSLGARVVLSTLESLNNITAWNTNHFNITSVHLMGPAVDYEEVVSIAISF